MWAPSGSEARSTLVVGLTISADPPMAACKGIKGMFPAQPASAMITSNTIELHQWPEASNGSIA